MLVGVDIGASRTKLVVLPPGAQQPVHQRVVETPVEASPQEFLTWLVRELQALHVEHFAGVGIGIAGLVNRRGELLLAPNLPRLRNFALQQGLQERLRCPILLDNDANVAAWAEALYGAAHDVESFLYVTLGTGVGGAIVLERRLWRGVDGTAGEIGHMVVDITATGITGLPPYRIGVLEEYTGMSALLRCAASVVRRYPHSELFAQPVTLDALARAYHAGDEAAQECLVWYGWVLGIGIASALALLGLQVVVLGGGIVEVFPQLPELVARVVHERALPPLVPTLQVRRAQFGSWAGALGAAWLVAEYVGSAPS